MGVCLRGLFGGLLSVNRSVQGLSTLDLEGNPRRRLVREQVPVLAEIDYPRYVLSGRLKDTHQLVC